VEVLIIGANVPFHPLTGGTASSYHFAREWGRRHQVTLVAPVFGAIDAGKLTRCAEELGVTLHAVPVHSGTRLRRLLDYAARLVRGAPTIRFYPELAAFVRQLVAANRFDVVDIEGTGFGGGLYLSAFDGLSARPRMILTFYDIMWHWWKRDFLLSANPVSLVRWLTYRVWEPRFVRQVDCCVFMSAVDAAIVGRVSLPKASLVVPVGFDVARFAVTPVPDTREVLFVGSFLHSPNRRAAIWLIADIWPALRRRVPDARLTVVGMNPPHELVALAAAAGVELVANAPDLQPYYARARAVIAPIQTGGGIRVKIVEACAAARPIVTTHIGAEGLPIVPDEHALFAEGTEGLATALARVLTDEALAQRLADNGRALVEQEFSWELLAKRKESAFYTHG
jgi:glycosyltransferase involved in cell wall biosynthesis